MEREFMAPHASGTSGSLWTCLVKHDVGAMILAVEPPAPATEEFSHHRPELSGVRPTADAPRAGSLKT